MKKIVNLLSAFSLVALLTTACQSEDIVYSGQEYVMFADSTFVMPILEKDTTFSVPVAATTTASYDRNYAVEIINDKSTAIRGFHFDFVDQSNNVVIKAGERVANVRLKGHYDNVGRKDSLVLSLRLIEPEAQKWNLYKNVTKVDFVKCHPFNMDKFLIDDGGNMVMYATFPFSDQQIASAVKGYKKDSHTLILKDMFGVSGSGPIRLVFDDSNPLDLLITVPEQPAFRESSNGEVWVRSVAQYPSYFNTFDNFFALYLEAYVPQIGSFGVFQYVFKCISKEEAADSENGVAKMSADRSISAFKLHKF